MRKVAAFLCAVSICACGGLSHAANRVEVESVSVLAGGTVAVGVYVENDVAVRSIALPLEIREVTSGSCMTSLVIENPVSGSRGAGYLGDLVITNTYPVKDGATAGCPEGYGTIAPLDFISPDGVLFSRNRILTSNLPAGSDFPVGAGIPYFRLTMDVTVVPGTFEIDTTCTTPSEHIAFVGAAGSTLIVPSFTMGTVTILPCDCPWQGDINADGIINAVDVALQIQIRFFGGVDPRDPGCPTTRSDYTGEGLTNAVDLVRCINYVYVGGPGPVDPCP